MEAAEKAVSEPLIRNDCLYILILYIKLVQAATLNNEQDWRNGLRVKLLEQKVIPDEFQLKNTHGS